MGEVIVWYHLLGGWELWIKWSLVIIEFVGLGGGDQRCQTAGYGDSFADL